MKNNKKSSRNRIIPVKSLSEEEVKKYTGKRDLASCSPSEITQQPQLKGIRLEESRQTMEDFWIEMDWYKTQKNGTIKLTKAKWKDNELVKEDAVRFLIEKVLHKDPRDITTDDFYDNRLCGLLVNYYSGSPYQALIEAGLVDKEHEKYMRRHGRARFKELG
ncbi:MAG: hypothetical protein HZB65_03760 [Candidatus Aenigmarchaeota archaeon]|nr:hypothetical protein [Candidatus Aenigmarchaeota archaeon]